MDSSCDTINSCPTYHYEGHGASFTNSRIWMDNPPPLRHGYHDIGGYRSTGLPFKEKKPGLHKIKWSEEESRVLKRTMSALRSSNDYRKEALTLLSGRTGPEIRTKIQMATRVEERKQTKKKGKNNKWSPQKTKRRFREQATTTDQTNDSKSTTAEPSSSCSSSSRDDGVTIRRPHKKSKANHSTTSRG